MLRNLFPHPLMTLLLVAIWLMLTNAAGLGNLMLALILGTLIPLFTLPYWPGRARLRNLPALTAYVAMVLWDIVLANIIVARLVLLVPNHRIRSAWVTVPLDLRSPEAVAILAGTITLTPGTVTADVSACGRVLLVHALHAPDPAALRNEIKTRYESRLRRIFE